METSMAHSEGPLAAVDDDIPDKFAAVFLAAARLALPVPDLCTHGQWGTSSARSFSQQDRQPSAGKEAVANNEA